MFKHLKEANMTYTQHMKKAMNLSWKSFKASMILFIHGLIPDIFTQTGSDIFYDIVNNDLHTFDM